MNRDNKDYRYRRWCLLKSNELAMWVVLVFSIVFFIYDPKDFGLWMPFVTIFGTAIIGIRGYFIKKEVETQEGDEPKKM